MLKRIAPSIIFPITLAAALGTTLYSIEQGWPAIPTMLGVFGVTIAIVFFGERWIPFEKSWLKSQKDIGADLIHTVVAGLVVPKILEVTFLVAIQQLAVWLNNRYGMGLWPSHWPLIAQLGIALVVTEFGIYWVHRWTHTVPLLWRFHAIHHSPGRLYWMNANRFHPVDSVVDAIPMLTFLTLLGVGEEVITLHIIVNGVHGFFQHGNMKVKIGPLNYIFSMAELHRWHHSKVLKEANANYGSNLIIWDIVFRTRFLPKKRRPPADVGISEPQIPTSYWGQLIAPFRWNQLPKPSARRRSAVA